MDAPPKPEGIPAQRRRAQRFGLWLMVLAVALFCATLVYVKYFARYTVNMEKVVKWKM